MRSGESDLHDGTSALMRKDIRAKAPVPLPYGDTTRRGLSASQEESPQQKWPCWYLISDFQLPELWENPRLLFKPPRLWGFVTAAQVNEDTPLDLQHLARISSKCKNGLEGVRGRCSPSSEWSLSGPSAKGHPNTGRWGAGSQNEASPFRELEGVALATDTLLSHSRWDINRDNVSGADERCVLKHPLPFGLRSRPLGGDLSRESWMYAMVCLHGYYNVYDIKNWEHLKWAETWWIHLPKAVKMNNWHGMFLIYR